MIINFILSISSLVILIIPEPFQPIAFSIITIFMFMFIVSIIKMILINILFDIAKLLFIQFI